MGRIEVEKLESIASVGSRAYVDNLAAAEGAVLAGQFNVAKLLRALGYSQRVMATNAARLLAGNFNARSVLEANAQAFVLTGRPDGLGGPHSQAAVNDERRMVQIEHVRARGEELVQRARESLARNGEIFDDDLGEILWSCARCGYIAEDRRPDTCPTCGAPAAEFEDFGPFYIDTPEHLGHRLPAEILSILPQTPNRMATLVLDVDRRTLAARPSPHEWCILEIVGHLIEIEDLFITRARLIFESVETPNLAVPVPAWKLHVGKGYESGEVSDLVERFTAARAATVRALEELEPSAWSLTGRMPWKNVSLIDLGTWAANHDLGHLAQIERRLRGTITFESRS